MTTSQLIVLAAWATSTLSLATLRNHRRAFRLAWIVAAPVALWLGWILI